MKEAFECCLMSWDEVHALAKQAAAKIKRGGFKPDVIVGLARGGWVNARILCDFLEVKELYSLKVGHWGMTATPTGKAELGHALSANLAGKKVLVVDDITDTGESLELAKTHVKTLGPAEVRTATLLHIDHSKHVPDFFAKQIKWAWIVFPWNFLEDCTSLVLKLLEEDARTTEGIVAEFKAHFKISIGAEAVREVLEELKARGKIEEFSEGEKTFYAKKT